MARLGLVAYPDDDRLAGIRRRLRRPRSNAGSSTPRGEGPVRERATSDSKGGIVRHSSPPLPRTRKIPTGSTGPCRVRSYHARRAPHKHAQSGACSRARSKRAGGLRA